MSGATTKRLCEEPGAYHLNGEAAPFVSTNERSFVNRPYDMLTPERLRKSIEKYKIVKKA